MELESEPNEENPMKMLTAIEIAELTVLRGNGDSSIIVLELINNGNDSRWRHQFPDLTTEQINALDETAFMTFGNRQKACDMFQELTQACAENGTGGLIEGTITLVVPDSRDDDQVEILPWDLSSETRPVLDGGRWKDEMIVERI